MGNGGEGGEGLEGKAAKTLSGICVGQDHCSRGKCDGRDGFFMQTTRKQARPNAAHAPHTHYAAPATSTLQTAARNHPPRAQNKQHIP